uniref:uncharacterized protein LOC101294251 n=1 Tax=Fragaria vesca subsp. vesca TaxID=101020 RepID=UPI0005CA3AD4|nr:PREDICTED: uncharacterized protein LOC101294251 [Fragaria vesca subsp. vesca]XP_011461036.1 PREDICTED: uncharacterized protein LOC101294251 [Fragaria vesca subsp. vesca]
MNLGAGQPVSLPYGVEPPSWYSNQYPYHSVQFSSPPQQWDLPFFSPGYHPPLPSYHPPPPSYHLSPPPNPYPAYAYHPYQQSYPHTLHHFIPTNQFVPPHTTHEPSPPIAYPRQAEPDLHPCSIPLQIDSEVTITDSKHCEFNFSDAKVSEFLESVSRLWDACMSKCMKGIQSSEGSSPSLLDDVPPPTHTPKIQSSEPKICSPMRPQPTSKPSHLGDTQSLSVANISMSRTKQASSKSIPATGGVKKCKFLQRNKLLMRKLAFKTNLRVQSSVAPPLLDDVVSAISNNTHASFCSGPNLGENGRECDALHLLDEMSKSKELCNAGKMSVGYMGIRDKGGGLATHCAIVYEYFQLPDKKTTAHLDYKPSVVSRNFGLKDKTARALAPSEALTGVHGFMEFGDCKLDYFGKGVLAVAGNVNDIIGPALIENDPVEQILVDNYMVQQLERFRNEWGWCKQELGENAISAVSLYVRKAGANLAGNKTLILHVPTKSDGSSITLLTKDICNNVWVSSGALKLVQSEFRTAFVLVMNKPTDIVDDNYENIQAHSKRVLELLLKKWKSRVIAKTQSQARLVQWFILSLQLCHCKRKVPTLACTLNACSNGNMLCLRLEINLEKMSLCLAEKWEKRDRIVKQMFDGNWERWKFIVLL